MTPETKEALRDAAGTVWRGLKFSDALCPMSAICLYVTGHHAVALAMAVTCAVLLQVATILWQHNSDEWKRLTERLIAERTAEKRTECLK